MPLLKVETAEGGEEVVNWPSCGTPDCPNLHRFATPAPSAISASPKWIASTGPLVATTLRGCPMAKIDFTVGSPLFTALAHFLKMGELLLERASEEKVRAVADGLLDAWLFWQRLFEKMGDRLLDGFGKEEG